MADVKLDSMMKKIGHLLARADHPNTPPPEADACRAKAEVLMRKYRIEETELIQSGKHDVTKPITVDINLCPSDSLFREHYLDLFGTVVHHAECMAVYRSEYVDGTFMTVGKVTGFEADIRFVEVLYQSARLVFGDRMEPKYKPELSEQENVYWMRKAGMERIRISEVMGWEKGGAKVTRLYKAECEARGEDPVLTGRGIDVKTYREEYAKGFTMEFWSRLERARNAVEGNDGAIVLMSRKEMVTEAFYELYPHLRPQPVDPNRKPAKSKPWKPTKADLKRWEKAQSAAGRAGRSAGERAAHDVDVQGMGQKGKLK